MWRKPIWSCPRARQWLRWDLPEQHTLPEDPASPLEQRQWTGTAVCPQWGSFWSLLDQFASRYSYCSIKDSSLLLDLLCAVLQAELPRNLGLAGQRLCTNGGLLVWQFSPVLFRGCSNTMTKYRNKDQQLMLELCSEPTFYNPGNMCFFMVLRSEKSVKRGRGLKKKCSGRKKRKLSWASWASKAYSKMLRNSQCYIFLV